MEFFSRRIRGPGAELLGILEVAEYLPNAQSFYKKKVFKRIAAQAESGFF